MPAEGPPAALLDWLPWPALVALLLQNGQGVKNATWRAYIEAGSYVDPILRPEELLRRHFKQVRGLGGWLAAAPGDCGWDVLCAWTTCMDDSSPTSSHTVTCCPLHSARI